MSYSDVMRMPTYERHMFLRFFMEEVKQQKDEIQESRNQGSSNTNRISGDEIKQWAAQNQESD